MTGSAVSPSRLTILRAFAVARWAAWLWMVAVVAFSTDGLRRPAIAWIAVATVACFALIVTVLVRTDPKRLLGPVMVVGEIVLIWALLIGDGYVYAEGHAFATGQNLAVQFPLLAVLAVAMATNPWAAAAAGLTIGAARGFGAVANGFTDWSGKHFVSLLATSLFHGTAAAVASWIGETLIRVEDEVLARRARDEVARTLHDTVLQTLALVERRAAATDPELAAIARRSDRELRTYLFGPDATDHTVAAAIRQAVARVSRDQDVDVTVNVVGDDADIGSPQRHAIAGAVGEAVTNAAKHARASKIVVYAEVDDESVFASVRDDGVGFDVETVARGQGLDGSINGRLADVGGRSEVVSTPGGGTEIRLWV